MIIDSNFPGGNIVADRIEGDTLEVHQDLRDTTQDWFYWYFRVLDVAGHSLIIRFTASEAIGVRGPAVSLDAGHTWRWLGKACVTGNSFTYKVPQNNDEVRFSFGMPYLEANLQAYLQCYGGHPNLRVENLCLSEQGRQVELLRLGCLDRHPKYKVMLTCRHHACEMMANYSLEGILESILSTTPSGKWFQENVQVLAIPFIDKDGVENGDQGKCRHPHDHNLDYNEKPIYTSVRALMNMVPQWAEGNLDWALDLHCPWIHGGLNEELSFVGCPDQHIWAEIGRFCDILEKTQKGPLVYNRKNNLDYGMDWNVGNEPNRCFDKWIQDLGFPGAIIEIPYANAGGAKVYADSAHEFGKDITRAIQAYFQGKRK